MASVTITSSFLGGATLSGGSPARTTTHERSLVIRNSTAKTSVGEKVKITQDNNSGRRDLVLAAAMAAIFFVPGIAMAAEPIRGTPVARKIYAPVCVTMPTARICHK